jgi:hypothetical protein
MFSITVYVLFDRGASTSRACVLATPLLLSPICIFERCLDSNQRAAVTTGALNSLSTHLPALKKRLATFPAPAGMSLTWAGIIKLFPARESLVRYIPAGDGNVAYLFLRRVPEFIDPVFAKTSPMIEN